MMLPRHWLVAVATVVALAIGVWLLLQNTGRESATASATASATVQTATVLPEPRVLPEFQLVDHNNQPFTRESLKGRMSLLFFGFTHCPDICPATLQQLAMARDRVAATMPGREFASLPEIILISVDPARDTPEILKRYVEYFGEGIAAATGPPEDLLVLTSALGIFFEPMPTGDPAGADYTVNHSTAVLVVDADARWQAIFSAPHSIDSFASDLPLLMASR
jgi:protein SCO1/2